MRRKRRPLPLHERRQSGDVDYPLDLARTRDRHPIDRPDHELRDVVRARNALGAGEVSLVASGLRIPQVERRDADGQVGAAGDSCASDGIENAGVRQPGPRDQRPTGRERVGLGATGARRGWRGRATRGVRAYVGVVG